MARYIDANHFHDIVDTLETVEGVPFAVFVDDVIQALYNESTADVQEVRHGHWIEDKETGSLICSECGHFTDEIIGDFISADEETAEALSIPKGTVIHRSMHPLYCSRCGSKMCGAESEAKIKELEEQK